MSRSRERGVLVVGGGVSGLTSALCLSRQGFDVTVVAEHYAPRVTSVVAAALWEWPPAICAADFDRRSLDRSKRWCATSLSMFTNLALTNDAGIFLRTANFYLRRPIDEDPRPIAIVSELRHKLQDFVHDSALIAANGVNPDFGVRDAYAYSAPMIDTDVYLDWLRRRLQFGGCRFETRKLSGNLRDQERALRDRYEVGAIVNCSGLGSRELVGDPLEPVRGALIRVRNDGRGSPRISQAHCVWADESSGCRDIVFIVPRGNDRLVLGGLAEPRRWSCDIGLDDYEPIRAMFDRCVDFLPILGRAEIDAAEPVRVGLRPFRPEHVRLEREPGTRIVHNYGHGGAGVTLSWGCALEVVDRVEEIFETVARA